MIARADDLRLGGGGGGGAPAIASMTSPKFSAELVAKARRLWSRKEGRPIPDDEVRGRLAAIARLGEILTAGSVTSDER